MCYFNIENIRRKYSKKSEHIRIFSSNTWSFLRILYSHKSEHIRIFSSNTFLRLICMVQNDLTVTDERKDEILTQKAKVCI